MRTRWVYIILYRLDGKHTMIWYAVEIKYILGLILYLPNVKIKYEIVLKCFRCLVVPEFKNIKNPFEFYLSKIRSIFSYLMCGARVILFLYT